MREVRVNIGITPYIDKIINKTMRVNDASRSLIVRCAVKKRYGIDKLTLVEGPINLYVRVNIPKEGAAYVRELAHKNNISMAVAYCSIIKKYIFSG